MMPSAIHSGIATHEHVTPLASHTPFHHHDGLISPPSTDDDSIADTNSLSASRHCDIDRSQLSALDIHLTQPAPEDLHDLICIGFGPATLAIAISLHDKYGALKSNETIQPPNVCFLERQPQFAWHGGMQLPGAKMQISFLKDLATPRDPRSRFTFINYLHHKGRLNQFINLSTFLPTRLEYEDYLKWCATHFEDVVQYGQEVVSIKPASLDATSGKVTSFSITSRDLSSNELVTRRARHVVVAVGGKPKIPKEFIESPQIIHSSNYSWATPQLLNKKDTPYRLAVVGSGQSAAEIYSDLQSRYPRADVTLIIKGTALRPSDDSPFVNEIFDPDQVENVWAQDPVHREQALALARNTNYGVVRLNLLEHLYEKLYVQRVQHPNPSEWKFRILTQRFVRSSSISTQKTKSGGCSESVELEVVGTEDSARAGQVENMKFDAVFVATGYVRNAHEEILEETRALLPDASAQKFEVGRDYRVRYDSSKVDGNAGVWLQGCNEKTHGLSDTLLSILAIRSMGLVDSMFGNAEEVDV